MRFIYQSEKPFVVLYGDIASMGAYCDDLAVFGIRPELIVTDEPVKSDESWNSIPIKPFDALAAYSDNPNLMIVPINKWMSGMKQTLSEIDSRLPDCIMRDIELLLRLSTQSMVENLPSIIGAPSDKTMFSLQLGFVLGGLETWVTNLYHQMKRADKPVVIFEPRQHSPYEYVGAEFFDVSSNDVLSIGPFDSFMPYVKRMIELLAQQPPRIYVDNGSYRLMAALYIAKTQLNLPIKVVSVLHGDVSIVYNRMTLCESIIDKFITVSDPIRDKLSVLLPNRVSDIDVQIQLPPAHPESLTNRTQSGKLRIAYAARLEATNKRSMWLIDIMDELTARGVQFELFIAGDGECFNPLKNHIEEKNLSGHVHMCGKLPREEMDAFWSNKHVFINFSISEGGPLTLFESMSHGLVPIVTNTGSASRLVFEGESGHIIHSPYEAVDALCALAENITYREKLQHGAMKSYINLQTTMGDPIAAFI